MNQSAFTPLRTEHLPSVDGVPRFRLVEPLVYTRPDGSRITVPAGFVTDGASIPRWLWWLFDPFGDWFEAACVHDFLYTSRIYSRFLADATFRDAMATLGVPTWIRVAMFYAVRVFGGRRAWK